MKTKEALVFGAGNIGRGFLGDLLHQSGYHTTFVDVDKNKVELINQEKEYPLVVVSSENKLERMVGNVAAVSFHDTDKVADAIVNADVILTAVGKNALSYVAEALSKGLVERIKQRPKDELQSIVIACENVQNNSTYLRNMVESLLPLEYLSLLKEQISFPNCVVDRIVPNTTLSANSLSVTVEEYFQFVVDSNSLRSAFPDIKGVALSSDLSAIVEQKLFTLNMAHAIAAYYGYLKGCKYIHEAIGVQNIVELVRGATAEVALMLVERHPSITSESQASYSEKIIKRFENPYLLDEVVRVAREPKRKLTSTDRLIRPAELVFQQGKIPAYIATGIAATLHYDYQNDAQAMEMVRSIRERGVETVLEEVSGLSRTSSLSSLVKADYLFKALY